MKYVVAYIGLGSNLDSPIQHVEGAVQTIGTHRRIKTLKISSWYWNTAISENVQPDYINGVLEISTDLPPHKLLDFMLEIELQHNRRRNTCHKNAARTLDLDLLLYGDTVISTPSLTIPHPRMTKRDFVLLPLTEIAPQIRLPCGALLLEYLPNVIDPKRKCRKLNANRESSDTAQNALHNHV